MSSSALGIVHVHSSYSHDGRDSLAALTAFAAERGIGFVGLTDHAEDFSEARWHEYVAECAGASTDAVRLVPGLEFRFADFRGLHLLAFGLGQGSGGHRSSHRKVAAVAAVSTAPQTSRTRTGSPSDP